MGALCDEPGREIARAAVVALTRHALGKYSSRSHVTHPLTHPPDTSRIAGNPSARPHDPNVARSPAARPLAGRAFHPCDGVPALRWDHAQRSAGCRHASAPCSRQASSERQGSQGGPRRRVLLGAEQALQQPACGRPELSVCVPMPTCCRDRWPNGDTQHVRRRVGLWRASRARRRARLARTSARSYASKLRGEGGYVGGRRWGKGEAGACGAGVWGVVRAVGGRRAGGAPARHGGSLAAEAADGAVRRLCRAVTLSEKGGGVAWRERAQGRGGGRVARVRGRVCEGTRRHVADAHAQTAAQRGRRGESLAREGPRRA